MNVQEKPTEANFKLKSIKSIKRGKLTVNAYKIVDSKEIPQSGEYPATPHPDLFQALDDLLPYVVNHFGINNYIKLAESKEFGANTAQVQMIKDETQKIIEKTRITGISLNEDGQGVVITSVINGESRNTKKLHFTNKEYGEELQEACELVKNETYQYMYDDKEAQLKIEEKKTDQIDLIDA